MRCPMSYKQKFLITSHVDRNRLSGTLTSENFCQDSRKIVATLSNATKAILLERYGEDFVNFGYDSSDVTYLH